MIRTLAIFASFAGSIMLAKPASACVPLPREPQLEGESSAVYEARVEKMARERDQRHAAWRQQRALSAPTLFIARAATSDFFAQEAAERQALEARRSKPGERPAVVPPPPLAFPVPTYFRPIAWLKGAGSQDLIRIETHQTTCGYMAMGDTLFAKDDVEYVFAAPEGPISENTLIDAIAIDKITDPDLVELVARHRERAGAGSESPEPSRP